MTQRNAATLINTLRQRLRIQLDQQEKLRWNAPAYLQLEIDDARAQIAALKARIRAERGTISDEAIDFPPGGLPPTPASEEAAMAQADAPTIAAQAAEIAELRRQLAAVDARAAIASAAYDRQQSSQRELEALYQATNERASALEQQLVAAQGRARAWRVAAWRARQAQAHARAAHYGLLLGE